MIALLITGVIALSGAVVLAASVLSWLVLRNTGVNWMFEGG
jgi:hypothetical protein